jgi:hypothetical protein
MSSLTYNAINQTPLPANLIHSPQGLAVWIDAVAPCVVGAQSKGTYDAIFAYLITRGVSLDTIEKAFDYSQYKWMDSMRVRLDLTVPTGPAMARQTTMGPDTTDRVTEAEIIARNFRIARNMEDIPKMKQLLRALQSFLTGMNTNQLEALQNDATFRILRPYVRIGSDGSVTIFENLVEFDAAESEREGEAAP